ncbi:hypothetical protein Tco_0327569 [Tanacetum coccineum]
MQTNVQKPLKYTRQQKAMKLKPNYMHWMQFSHNINLIQTLKEKVEHVTKLSRATKVTGEGIAGTGHGCPESVPPRCTHPADVEKLKKSYKRLTKQVSMIMKLFKSDDKMSQMLTQLESQPAFGSGSGTSGVEDDELADDEDGDEDEEDDEDADS